MSDPRLHDRLFLLDGSSLAFRAFFALPESITTQAGQPTNALFGLSQMLLKLVAEYRPGCIVCAWDAREKTFRDELYDQYKAQRPSHARQARRRSGRSCRSSWRGSASSISSSPATRPTTSSGTLAEEAKRQGIRSVVVTGDRDAMQIVDDDIWVMSTGRGVTDVKIYTPAAVLERFGVTPAQIPDYIGLKGDTSDNIPGVPGIGEKTAAQLLQQFGSIDEMYRRLDEVKSDKRRALLRGARGGRAPLPAAGDHGLRRAARARPGRGGHHLRVPASGRAGRRRLRALRVPQPAPPAARDRRGCRRARGAAGRRQRRAGAARAGAGRRTGGGPAREGGGRARLRAARRRRRRRPRRGRARRRRRVPGGAGRRGQGRLALAAGRRTPWCTTPRRSRASCTRRRARPSTPPWPPTCSRRSGRRRSARCSRSPAPTTAPSWSKGRRPRPPRPRAPPSRGAWPRPSGRASSSSASSGCSARSSCRSSACSRRWRPPASRWTRTGSARSRRACATASTSSPTRSTRLAGEPFTIGSPQQLADVLFNRLGLETGRKGKTGYSTDARVLRGLRDQHPIVPAVEEWRELTKLLNTYLEPLPARLDPVTGRLHTTFNQLVAATGRLSSYNPNLQNIPVRTDLGPRSAPASWPRTGISSSSPTTRRSSCGSWPRSRGSRRCSTRTTAARTCTASPRRPSPASRSRRSPSSSASAPRRPTSASCTGSRRSASRSRSTSPWTRRRPSSRRTSPSTPGSRSSASASSRRPPRTAT